MILPAENRKFVTDDRRKSLSKWRKSDSTSTIIMWLQDQESERYGKYMSQFYWSAPKSRSSKRGIRQASKLSKKLCWRPLEKHQWNDNVNYSFGLFSFFVFFVFLKRVHLNKIENRNTNKEKYIELQRNPRKSVYQTKCEAERNRCTDVSLRDM